MLFQPPIYHQNKGEGVLSLSRYFYVYLFVLSVLIVSVCILCVRIVFYHICIYLRINGLFYAVRA